MGACSFSGSIDLDCEDLSRLGGIDSEYYIFDPASIDKYNFDVDGYVESIDFLSYGGLYKFESAENSCSAGYTATKGEGGTAFFSHTASIKVITTTPADDEVIKKMLVAKMGLIIKSKNDEYFIYGGYNGMVTTEGTYNTGVEDTSDVSDILTLAGGERKKALRIFDTDSATTKALLESYVI